VFNTGVLPWSQILPSLSGRLVQGDLAIPALGVSTDSRTIQPGNLFVALSGPHFDGQTFLSQAFERGAAGAVVSGPPSWTSIPAHKIIIEVQDTLRALGDLAHLWRKRFSVPVIGLTGSNGKTTTKEMLAGILEATGGTLKNPGNLNNLIGLPLTLLGLGPEHRFAVLEMGMNRSGEIRRLSAIAVPTVGLVTNIGPAHLEGLGSLEAIARAKGELFEALAREGWAVINQDDPRILELTAICQSQKITYGLDPRAEVRAEGIQPAGSGVGFFLCFQGQRREIRIPLPGRHNVSNALAAAAAALVLGLSVDRIQGGLEGFSPPAHRLQIRPGRWGAHLLDDSYNANPASVQAALTTFQSLRQDRRGGLVLGDMLELGDSSRTAHQEIGARIGGLGVDYLVTIGQYTPTLRDEALKGDRPPSKAFHCSSPRELLEQLDRLIQAGDWVLIKGSRGMALESIAAALQPEEQG
jgi:UDP-N-acetylmuramoyl-tripeptide--D-alanyl-D-alanine ligase